MIWLIGAGQMAVDYAMVLQAQEKEFIVIGRGTNSAENFTEKTGAFVCTGGLEQWLLSKPELPQAAIVAVNIDQLASAASQLLDYGVRKILQEKPGGLNIKEIQALNHKAESCNAEIFIAYNRRFYASTLKAQEYITEDGGVTSFNFEFTEWSHMIEKSTHSSEVKHQWSLGNSFHVVDLAFYLGGHSKQMSSYSAGSLPWHSSAAIFSGAGVSETGALFSYQANWAAPGRWGVEALTKNYRLYFRPLEQLHIQKIGVLAIEKVEIDDNLDKRFKPGLYLEVETFFNFQKSKDHRLLKISQQLKNIKAYKEMLCFS